MSKLVKAVVLLDIEKVKDWPSAFDVAFGLANGPGIYGQRGNGSASLREVMSVESYILPPCSVCAKSIPDGYAWERVPGTNDVRHAGCRR